MKQNHRFFLWITDPWDTLDHRWDTTLRLAEEAEALGIPSHWCDARSIRLENGRVLLEAARLGRKRGLFRTFEPSDFPQLHYRVDPPIAHAYQHPLQLLALALFSASAGARARIVNPPELLLLANEKLEASLLPGLAPEMLVSSEKQRLLGFIQAERRVVLKPLHEAQSRGVELLRSGGTNERAKNEQLLRRATLDFTRPALLQRFLDGVHEGETRLWFCDGALVGTARKLPLSGDFRVNIDRGSRIVAHELTRKEQAAAQRVSRHLRARGIRLAAVDLIEAQVTDFNYTSPGLLRQLEAVTGENLARKIVTRLNTGKASPRAYGSPFGALRRRRGSGAGSGD